MPLSKKQLMRLVRLVSLLKENRYPNCSRFSEEMRKVDLDENLNVACTPKTIFRDIQTLKNDFNARAFFYFLEKFSSPQTGEFFESQKEEHFHFSKNSPGETGTSF